VSRRETYADGDHGRSQTEQQRHCSVADTETPTEQHASDDRDQWYCRSDERVSAVSSLARHGGNAGLKCGLSPFVLHTQKHLLRI